MAVLKKYAGVARAAERQRHKEICQAEAGHGPAQVRVAGFALRVRHEVEVTCPADKILDCPADTSVAANGSCGAVWASTFLADGGVPVL